MSTTADSKANGKDSVKSNGHKANGAEKPQPSAFGGRTAFLVLAASVLMYAYQTGFFRSSNATFSGASIKGDPGPKLPTLVAEPPMLKAIKEEFQYAWAPYAKNALGQDEYHPQTETFSNFADSGSIGYTLIDALDSMQIMGLDKEYKEAYNWLATNHTFERRGRFNTFEVTIRVLGGLLSSYHLSGNDPLYLQKATDLGDRILGAFNSPTGLPWPNVDLLSRQGLPAESGLVSLSEVSTLQLELRYLSQLTGNYKYWEKGEEVMKLLRDIEPADHLLPIGIDANAGKFTHSDVKLGAKGDSYYEYLLKQYLQTGRKETGFLEMYNGAMASVHDKLAHIAFWKNHTFIAELLPDGEKDGERLYKRSPKQDHLVCYLGGNLMLGAWKTGSQSADEPINTDKFSSSALRDWELGKSLLETCMHTHETHTGLPPEIAHFWASWDGKRWKKKMNDFWIAGLDFPGVPSFDSKYVLRPETIESIFIAYRLTGDPRYRAYGRVIFDSIKKHAKVADGKGYAHVLNCDSPTSIRMNDMESFFLSETLKYLYLLFSDSTVLPFDKYVFSTEAHPFPIFDLPKKTSFS